MSSKAICLHLYRTNIELTVVNASNTKRQRDVVLMFGQRRRQ